MPNSERSQTVYIHTGNPDTMNTETLLRPGELGVSFDANDKKYQIVKLDSGCTAAQSTGVVAANQLAFWKDRSAYLVTNCSSFALLNGVSNSYRNNVAGIFRTAVTAGYYCAVLQRGRNIAVKATSGTAGMLLVANTGSTSADALGIAVDTAATNQCLGVVVTDTANTTCYADLDIADIP